MASKKGVVRNAKKRRVETEIVDEIFPPKNEYEIKPLKWTEKQAKVIETSLKKDSQIIFINAPAGIGKTSIAIYCSLVLLKEKSVNKILFVRAPVEACDAKIGFLPSTLEDKMQPYLQCGEDAMTAFIPKVEVIKMKENGVFSIMPIGFCRGLSFHNTAVIIEEGSDLRVADLELAMSRYGKFSKMFIIGSPRQSSIKNSGFKKVFDAFNNEESQSKGIHCFEFANEDSMRSNLSKFILNKFENEIDP